MANPTYSYGQDVIVNGKNVGQAKFDSNTGAPLSMPNTAGTAGASPITPLPSSVQTNAQFGSIASPQNTPQGSLTAPIVPVPSTSAVTTYAQQAQASIDASNAAEANNPFSQNRQSAIDAVLGLQDQAANKSIDQANFNAKYGVNDANQRVQDYSSQIFANNARSQADKLGTGALGGITTSDRSNIDNEIERTAAIRNLSLGSQLQAAQGNLSIAQDLSKQALDAKYAPMEARIQNIKDYLAYNKDDLERFDKKAYQDQVTLANAKQKDLEATKAQAEKGNAMILNAVQGQAPQALIAKAQKAINEGKSPTEVANILGTYSMSSADKLDLALKSAQISASKASAASSYASANNSNASAAKTRAETGQLGAVGGIKQEDIAKAIESKTGQQVVAAKDLVTKLNDLNNLYTQYGARPTTAEGIGAIDSARSASQLAITAAFGQGAISDGDRKSYSDLTGKTFGIAPTAKLNQTIASQTKNYETKLELLNAAYPGINKIPTFSSTVNTVTPEAQKQSFWDAVDSTINTANYGNYQLGAKQ